MSDPTLMRVQRVLVGDDGWRQWTVGTSKRIINAQARAEVQAYVRKLLGSNRQAGEWGGEASIKLSLPKASSTGRAGETPHSLPRQLAATAYTKSSKTSSKSGSNSIGNAWLISPIASTVKSILSLFGGGSSTTQSTKYRTSSRQTFRIVEGISPETGSGTQRLNESATGLTGVVSRPSTGEVASVNSATWAGLTTTTPGGEVPRFEDRQALVTALRRSLSESRGISDVLSEFQDGL